MSESVDVSQFVTDANFESAGWGGRPTTRATEDVRAGTVVFAEAVEVLGLLLGVQVDETRCEVALRTPPRTSRCPA